MIAALLLVAAMQAQDTSHLTLTTLVNRALDTHPSVAIARALQDRATADLDQARAPQRPSLSFDASFNQFQEPMVVAPLHRLDLTNPPVFDRSLYQAGLSVNWTLLDFGQRAARVSAERALQDAAGAQLTSSEQDVMAATVHAYLSVQDAQQTLDAQNRLVAALQSAEQRVQQLEANGKAAHVDVLRMTAQLQSARADSVSAASRLDIAQQALARFTGTPVTEIQQAELPPLAPSDSAPPEVSGAADPADLVAAAQQASPAMRQLEQQSRAAQFSVNAARATRLPSLQLQGAYIDRGQWLSNYSAEWQLGIAVSYPVYTGGARTSTIRRASADQRAAAQRVRAGQLAIEQQVDETVATWRQAHARVSALQSTVAQMQEVERIEKLALDVGTSVQTDYLDAEAKLYAAQAELIQARHAELGARVDLAHLLGTLSVAWLAQNVETHS